MNCIYVQTCYFIHKLLYKTYQIQTIYTNIRKHAFTHAHTHIVCRRCFSNHKILGQKLVHTHITHVHALYNTIMCQRYCIKFKQAWAHIWIRSSRHTHTQQAEIKVGHISAHSSLSVHFDISVWRRSVNKSLTRRKEIKRMLSGPSDIPEHVSHISWLCLDIDVTENPTTVLNLYLKDASGMTKIYHLADETFRKPTI